MIRYSFTVSIYCCIDMYCRSLVGDSGEIDQLYPNYWELIIASKLTIFSISGQSVNNSTAHHGYVGDYTSIVTH